MRATLPGRLIGPGSMTGRRRRGRPVGWRPSVRHVMPGSTLRWIRQGPTPWVTGRCPSPPGMTGEFATGYRRTHPGSKGFGSNARSGWLGQAVTIELPAHCVFPPAPPSQSSKFGRLPLEAPDPGQARRVAGAERASSVRINVPINKRLGLPDHPARVAPQGVATATPCAKLRDTPIGANGANGVCPSD